MRTPLGLRAGPVEIHEDATDPTSLAATVNCCFFDKYNFVFKEFVFKDTSCHVVVLGVYWTFTARTHAGRFGAFRFGKCK